MNLFEERGNDTLQPWIYHDRSSVLCLSLMGRPFDQYFAFSWNLVCVPFDHDRFLAWDSFSQDWFMHDDGFGPIFFMVHSAKSGQPCMGLIWTVK